MDTSIFQKYLDNITIIAVFVSLNLRNIFLSEINRKLANNSQDVQYRQSRSAIMVKGIGKMDKILKFLLLNIQEVGKQTK